MEKKKKILYCYREWTVMVFFQGLDTPSTHTRMLTCCVITVRAAQRNRRGHTVRCINACAQISLVDTHREREERHAGGGSNGAATVGREVRFFCVCVFSAVAAADDDVQLQLLLFTRAFSSQG